MNAAYILGISVVLQVVAAVLAIRLIPLTGRRWAWILIALALLLIVPRRCIAIGTILTTPNAPSQTVIEAYVNLALSACLLAGMWLIGPMFRQFAQAQKAQKESEATARRQAQELEQIYRYAPIGLAVADRDLRLLRVNEMQARNIGATVEEIQGKTIPEIFPDLMPQLREFYAPVLNEGRPVLGVEITGVRSKDGSVGDRLASYFPLKSDTGEVIGIIGAVLDITERKRAEEALRLNESRLETLLKLDEMADAPLQDITRFAMEEGVRLTNSRIGYLAFMNEDETVLTMHSWSRVAMAECLIEDKPIVYPMETVGLWGEAVRRRKPVVTNDYQAPNPYKKGCPSGHVPMARHMNVPVFDGEKIVAVAGVGNKEDPYDDSDVRQLQLLMDGMWRLLQRKRAEEALRESQEKYKQLVETTGTGYVIINDKGLVADANPEYVRMTGRQRVEEILGHSVLEWTAPHDLDRNGREVKKCFAKGFVRNLEVDYVTPDGRCTPIEVNATVLHTAGTVQIQTLCRDITDRKRVENALRESEYFFKESQRAAFIGSYKCDFTADCWESSEVLDRIFGIDRNYSRNVHGWLEIVHPDDRGMMDRHLREEVFSKHKPFHKEYRITRKSDGAVRWVNGLGEVKLDGKGDVISLIGTIQDITDRKHVEEALRRAKDELEQRVAERTSELSKSRERLSMLFRTSPAGIFLSRLEDGLLLEVNDAYWRLLGYTAQEMIGRTTQELGIFVNPDDRKRSIEILKRDGRNENLEVQYRHKSGRIVHLLINALPVNVDGVPCVLGTSLDITERKQAEQALRAAAHKLIAVREEERRRVATDLHDSLAQGLVALKLAVHTSNVTSALVQCDRLIQEVREICQGLYPAVLERLGLAPGLTQLAEAYEPSVSVTVEYPPELSEVRFDKDLEISLYRVAQEAINNAVRHGKAGQIEVELTLSDARIGLSITDDGGGFDVAGQTSSGLGLVTMKDRIASIAGTLDITSEPGRTVVRATVPLPKNLSE